MKLIVILAGLFAVVAVAHAYSTNLLEALLQALPAELEQEEPSMERYRHGPYEEVRIIIFLQAGSENDCYIKYTYKLRNNYTV